MNWTSLLLAAIATPPSPESSIHAPAAGSPTPAPQILAEEGGKRPWYFGKLSSGIVEYAVKERKSDVESASASSIVARIVDVALEFPEATQVLNFASSIIVADGETIEPSHAKQLASKASSGYNAARTSPVFKGYMHYIATNMKDFNVIKDPSEAPPKQREAYESYMAKMQETPDGKEAVKIGEALYSEVMRDAGMTPPAKPGASPEPAAPAAHSAAAHSTAAHSTAAHSAAAHSAAAHNIRKAEEE